LTGFARDGRFRFEGAVRFRRNGVQRNARRTPSDHHRAVHNREIDRFADGEFEERALGPGRRRGDLDFRDDLAGSRTVLPGILTSKKFSALILRVLVTTLRSMR